MRTMQTLATAALTAGILAGPAPAQETERCFGVSRAGQNDGTGDDATAGGSTLDYQGDAWQATPRGTCLTLPVPDAPDGTPRRGSLDPLNRDRP